MDNTEKRDKCQQIVEQYKNGNTEVINELPQYINSLIYSLLRPYKMYADKDEMYQVAWQTIMKCMQNYDPSRGTLFTTFAYPAIKRELRQYRQRIDKHQKYKIQDGEIVHTIYPLEGYIPVKNRGNTKYAPLTNILISNEEVENTAFINEIRKVMVQELNKYKNEKQKAIIADYLYGIKGTYIASQYNVSQPYVSRVVRDFFNRVKNEVSK